MLIRVAKIVNWVLVAMGLLSFVFELLNGVASGAGPFCAVTFHPLAIIGLTLLNALVIGAREEIRELAWLVVIVLPLPALFLVGYVALTSMIPLLALVIALAATVCAWIAFCTYRFGSRKKKPLVTAQV